MPKISAVYAPCPDVERRVLDEIEDQFRLTKDDLTRITSHFLDDFKLGLSEYNHPMAMMYASSSGHEEIVLTVLTPSVRHS